MALFFKKKEVKKEEEKKPEAPTTISCPSCGASVMPGSISCPSCSTVLEAPKAPEAAVYPSQLEVPAEEKVEEVPRIEKTRPVLSEMPIPELPPSKSLEGPLFISLDRFKQVRAELADLKYNSSALREVLADLKTIKKDGATILQQSNARLNAIEKRVDEISKILRVA